MNHSTIICLAAILTAGAAAGQTPETTITIQADQAQHPVSRYLTGACLEDVNHEVYGGLYSQMIFGESFAEPAPPRPLKGFTAFGGGWTVTDNGGVQVAGGDGPKLVCDRPAFSEGEAGVELLFPKSSDGNGGLILKVRRAGPATDEFNGYEVSLEPSGYLVLGRHRQNWEPLRRVPCDVPINQWIKLAVRLTATSLEVLVNGQSMLQYEDTDHPLSAGMVGLRVWRQEASFRNLSVSTGGETRPCAFAYDPSDPDSGGVSGLWSAWWRGSAKGQYSMETNDPFVGAQSQRLTFTEGAGEVGIANQGLKRWGLSLVGGSAYDGCLDVRAGVPTEVSVALESADGTTVYAEQNLSVTSTNWQRLTFTLTPTASNDHGRFSIKLKQPGSVTVGYAFLQPGDWGRFQGLPARKDVVEGLIGQGVTVLRYGGSMVNATGYRWKKMIGPRDHRPPYTGTWYPYSTDGWGVLDFLNFCEAAGFLGIPDLNVNETPQDMADFIEYVNGPTNSMWGAQRLADGHPQPYGLKYLELGNEERVDDRYFEKFQALARAVWAADPNIILVVGDFSYHQVITDPFSFRGADSGITTLAAQQQILQLARQNHREVWFDLHVWTDGPAPDRTLAAMFSYDRALGQIAGGAEYKVVVFELNANNHAQRRALANALAINAIERSGRLPIVTSANCLQPDGQNDNGWDQGLLFLNPGRVWTQPPGYVMQMISRNYEPVFVESRVEGPDNGLQACAKRDENGKSLVLCVVNPGDKATPASIVIPGYTLKQPTAGVEELAGDLTAANTATAPDRIQPVRKPWRPEFKNDRAEYDFPPHSFTVIKFHSD